MKMIDRMKMQTSDRVDKNIEIILIDDGSTDMSGEKCDKWKARDERILVIHQENKDAISVFGKLDSRLI